MDRRLVLFGTAFLTAFGQQYRHAVAQDAPPDPFDMNTLSERLNLPGATDRMFTDVAFFQSWRAELAPRGYENEAWLQGALANRRAIWERISGNAGALIARDTGSDFVAEFDKRALENFDRNRAEYYNFLGDIGIDPGGKAASRITQSLRDYSSVNAAALGPGGEVEEAAKSSFFWPWC